MKKILAFAGSNSSKSINKKLIDYTATLITNSEIKVLDLQEFSAPIYSQDIQNEKGIPESINRLLEEIKNSDAFIISTPEHNGMVTSFFKNLMDWVSRAQRKFFDDKPILLLSTSPGRGGGTRGLKNLEKLVNEFAGNVIATFSFPSFNHNFDSEENKITDENLLDDLKKLVKNLETEVSPILT